MSYTPLQLTSPAQGDLLYYDGTKFVNLAHGTTGQFLETQGASANPAWATVPVPDYSPAVILAPGTVNRNLVQPTADGDSLTLRPFSDAQTNPVFRVQNAVGNADLFTVDAAGTTTSACSPATTANVIFQVNDGVVGPFANVMQLLRSGLGSVYGLFELFANHDTDTLIQLYGHGAGQSGNFLEIYADGGSLSTLINYRGDLSVGAALVAEAGPTPQIGFFGGAAVGQQLGASAAAVAAVTDPNAKAALQSLQDALAAFTLITSPA